MKKYLLSGLLTSMVMIGILAGAYFLLSGTQKKNEEARKKETMEELGILEEQKKEQDISAAVPLSAEDGSLLAFSHKNAGAVYNTAASKAVKEELDRKKRKTDYTLDHALWAIDPFGTNSLSLYVYFQTKTKSYVKYTVYVEDKEIPDFTRTLWNGQDRNLTTEHEYQLIGLVAGRDNYITLKLYNSKDKVIGQKQFKITVNPLDKGIKTKLSLKAGKSEELPSEGLFAVLGCDVKNNEVPAGIYLYDNTGILRSAVPLINYRSDRLVWTDADMIYSCSQTAFARVSPIGQVLSVYDLGTYKLHHDFAYNGFGGLYILATDTTAATVMDQVISLDLNTGKVKKLLDFTELMPQVKKKAKKGKGAKRLDWLHLNSIAMAEGGDVIVSSRELSSIIKVENVLGQKPDIRYILADPDLYQGMKISKKLLKKAYPEGAQEPEGAPEEQEEAVNILATPTPEPEPFTSQYGQHTVSFEPDGSLEEGQYYLSLYNNNYGYSPTRPDIKWNRIGKETGTEKKAAGYSMFYRYLVDENAGAYSLTETIKVPYSSIVSSSQSVNTHRVINSGTAGLFGEYDRAGTLICQYEYPVKKGSYHYRVFKYDLKQYLFE